MSSAFVNGSFVPVEEATLSLFDAGLQHGVGLFETMLGGCRVPVNSAFRDAFDEEDNRAGTPWVLDIDDHLARLAESARALGLSDDLRVSALREAVFATVRQSGLARARVRLTVTGGQLNMLKRDLPGSPQASTDRPAHEPGVFIVATAATQYPQSMLDQGVMAVIADTKANPFNPFESHKTLNYWWRLRELQAAAAKNAGEALVFSITNHLCGGCVSNALIVKDGEVYSPPCRGEELEAGRDPFDAAMERSRESTEEAAAEALGAPGIRPGRGAPPPAASKPAGLRLPSAVLPGITRLWASRNLAGEGTVLIKKYLSVSDVLEADEVLLTNSSWGVLPVVAVEGKVIGTGKPGDVGRLLMAAWKNTLDTESA